MRLTVYKGYEIQVDELSGDFSVADLGQFPSLATAKNAIDRHVAAEKKIKPIRAFYLDYNSRLVQGRVTSFVFPKGLWFVSDNDRRERRGTYGGDRTYSLTPENLAIVAEMHAQQKVIEAEQEKLSHLESKLIQVQRPETSY